MNQAYLTRDFFTQLHDSLRDKMLLCLAFDAAPRWRAHLTARTTLWFCQAGAAL